jgi:hypothetical protein
MKGTIEIAWNSTLDAQQVAFLQSSMNLGHATYEHAWLDVKHNFMEIKVGEVNRTHGYNC